MRKKNRPQRKNPSRSIRENLVNQFQRKQILPQQFQIIPTFCRISRLKQICLVNMIPAILIILIVHIIIAIRWMLIKILSAVTNDWERIKVIVSGGCCLDIKIIRKMDLKIKMLR